MKRITIKGMSCEHCQKAVTQALTGLGLQNVKVDLARGTAAFSQAEISEQSVRNAVEDAGFEVAGIE